METAKNIFLSLLTGVVVAVIVGSMLVAQLNDRQDQSFGGPLARFTKVATSSAITVTTSSGDLLATSSSRVYAAFVNTGSNYVCLSLDSDKAAVDCQGIYLAPSGGSYEITGDNLYTGAINAISNTGNSVVTVTEALTR